MTKSVGNKPCRGRKQILNERNRSFIRREVTKNRKISAATLAALVEKYICKKFKSQTIANALHQDGYMGKQPRKKPVISKKNRLENFLQQIFHR